MLTHASRLLLSHAGSGLASGACLAAPVAAMAVGLLCPALAEAARESLPILVAVLLTVSVILAEPGPLRWAELVRPLALVAANLLLGMAIAAVPWFGASAPWLALVAIAPPAGSAALIAGLLGLTVRPVLWAQMVGFLALPLTAPALAALLPGGAAIDPERLALRIALLILLPCVLGVALRLRLGERRRRRCLQPLQGLGALTLIGIGLATAAGLEALLLDGLLPSAVAGISLVLALGTGVGWLVGTGQRRLAAAGSALAGGIRNCSVLWSACVGVMPTEGAIWLQCGAILTLVAPALVVVAIPVLRGRSSQGSVASPGVALASE